MPKSVTKKKTRTRDREPDPDVVTGPSRRQTPGINPFNIPAPKGPNPGRQTRSSVWVPKTKDTAEADPDEEAAFGPRTGDVMPASRRNRLVSEAALSAAQLRMSGRRVEPDDDDEDPDEDDTGAVVEESEQEFDEEPAPAPERVRGQRTRPASVPAAAAAVASTRTHPAVEYESAPPTNQSKTVARQPEGTLKHTSGISISPVTIADVDRLWDWIRGDDDGGQAFLWHRLTTSLSLHQYIQSIAQSETQGVAAIRSVYGGGQHLGFVMLAPILTDDQTALMHVYLRKDLRGHLGQIVGPLVDLAAEYRPGLHLAVWSADDTWARLHRKLLAPLGFTERVMFIR